MFSTRPLMDNAPINFNRIVNKDLWITLKVFTPARIALGRTGVSLPLKACLDFKLAHAHARDAVNSTLDIANLTESLQPFLLPVHILHSSAANRYEYLQRPDLGRRLNESSVLQLKKSCYVGFDICIILADGLSATAINNHSIHLLEKLISPLKKSGLNIAPLVILQQGRVASGDEIAFLLNAKLALVLIGERPGLTSPDSLGAYTTYQPSIGMTDESRNCISNIRPEGLQYEPAARKIFYMIQESFRLKLSGVMLKDNSNLLK